MGKKKPVAKKQHNRKIISIHMDAAFFFERAVQSLDRYHYEKALKYFRRAVEYEPDNPVNHCNMAGILSEIGQYEESNDVLQGILQSVDPSMTECYFYMANNYANLEDFEAAEKALVMYLEKDTTGQFVEESEEMMDLLSYELNRGIELKTIKSREGLFEHDKARSLLEAGRFDEAVRLLEKVVRKHSEFLAAKNNLALAYYYMGEESKAFEVIHGVLRTDPGNLHALCNLAIFYRHAGETRKLLDLMEVLGKTYPFHHEHVFKLATTMGILGNHEMAYRHFKRLLKYGEQFADPCLYHYTAVAAYNMNHLEEARRLWKLVEKTDPESDIARFYLSEYFSGEGGRQKPLSYQYQLPFEEQVMAEARQGEPASPDPLLRSSFLWALKNGDHHTKLQVIQALSKMDDQETEKSLRSFLLDPKEDDYLKKVAIFVLRSLGAKAPIHAVLDGRKIVLQGTQPASGLPEWKEEWQRVIEQALNIMQTRYDIVQQHDLQTLWVEYLNRIYPQTPRLKKTEGWAAALEYLTAKMHRRNITYQEVAALYRVSVGTVNRNVKQIDQVCGLREKMRAIFSPYE